MAENQQEELEIQETTSVQEEEVDIDAMFGVGADSIMLPEEEKKKTVFSNNIVDTSFIDRPEPEQTTSSEESKEELPKTEVEVEAEIDELNTLISEEETNVNKGGRPKLDKSGLLDLANKMIEEGSLIPFDDDKPLEEYTAQDYRELFEANFQERENKVRESTPQEFFKALPQELQIAAKYVADGGTDLKGLFKTLSHVEEVVELDPTNENDQAQIARQYLQATRFGTSEEIEEQITEWEDLDKLETKASQFKPKLDKMQESIIAQRLSDQENRKKQQEQAAQVYMEDVYNTLATGELDGVKLDRKIQSMLYSGLVQPNYPSMSGKPTNLLGHLLEKYQFVEPNHSLIAEALWLLQDPKGYKEKIKSLGSKETTEETVRSLKTQESRKLSSSVQEVEEPKKQKRKTISRGPSNMFKRF